MTERKKNAKDVKVIDNQVCNNHIWELRKKGSQKGRSRHLEFASQEGT